MKSLLLAALGSLFILQAQAQEANSIQRNVVQETRTVNKGDTVRLNVDSTTFEVRNNGESKKVKIMVEYENGAMDKNRGDSTKKGIEVMEVKEEDKVFAGIVFARFDLGLAKMLDHGSLTLSPENEFLKHRAWKSVNVGFDVLQMGYKFTDQFRMHLAAGFDWTHFRLKENILFLKDTRPLSYVESDIDYKKNRFSTSYLRVPLTFELKTKPGSRENQIRLAVGPVVGFLLQGSQKLKSKEEGKQKVKDSFNFAPVTYGAFARLGVGSFGIYAKYYFNDMFINSPEQEGLRNLSAGLMLFF